jgi:hypothetical protein
VRASGIHAENVDTLPAQSTTRALPGREIDRRVGSSDYILSLEGFLRRFGRPIIRLACLAFLAAAAAGCVSTSGAPPLWESEEGLPGDVKVTRAVFGLYEDRTEADGTNYTTFRPITTTRSSPNDSGSLHVLPPIYETGQSKSGQGRTIIPLYFQSSRGTEKQREEGVSNDDTWLFPLWAWGSDPKEGSYFMFLPFGGTLKNKFFADQINIYIFPLYLTTRAGDWNSSHILWPFIAWGSSPTRHHFRIIPFWSQTDGATYGRRSLLWPFIHWNWEKRGERDFRGWMFFPLVGNRKSTDETSSQWTFLFPFFQFAHDDVTGDRYTAIVWPIYKRSIRPGVEDSTWIWPFWGHTELENATSTFYIWPLGWITKKIQGKVEARRNFFVPFYMRSTTGPIDGEPTAVAQRSWPLFSYHRNEEDHERFRFPEIVPVFGWDPGERVYSDLLSIVRWERDATGRVAWDGPLGLFGYRKEADGSSVLRLLWWFEIPLGDGS